MSCTSVEPEICLHRVSERKPNALLYKKQAEPNSVAPLLSLGGAARCLALILLYGCDQGPTEAASVEEPLQALVLWALSQLQSSASTSLALVSTTLTVLLSRPEARSVFQSNGGVGYISRHLRSRNGGRRSDGSGATAQQLYELCFCLWTLTYELNVSTSVRAHFARDGAVPALVNLVATAPREKVTRVALSALRNLAMCTTEPSQQKKEKKDADGKVFLAEMIGCGLIKSIDVLKDRQWTDPDIVEGESDASRFVLFCSALVCLVCCAKVAKPSSDT